MASVSQKGFNVADNTLLIVALGGGLAVYFGLIKPAKDALAAALEKLGFKDSAKDKAEEKAIATSDVKNGWNPNYYKTIGRQKNVYLIKQATAQELARTIYGAKRNSLTAGGMNDDEEAVYGVLRKIPSHAHLSLLADTFYTLYKKDLLGYLKSFLSSEDHWWAPNEMAIVASIVLAMPDYIEVKK